jgi:hypothetical protein
MAYDYGCNLCAIIHNSISVPFESRALTTGLVQDFGQHIFFISHTWKRWILDLHTSLLDTESNPIRLGFGGEDESATPSSDEYESTGA